MRNFRASSDSFHQHFQNFLHGQHIVSSSEKIQNGNNYFQFLNFKINMPNVRAQEYYGRTLTLKISVFQIY